MSRTAIVSLVRLISRQRYIVPYALFGTMETDRNSYTLHYTIVMHSNNVTGFANTVLIGTIVNVIS